MTYEVVDNFLDEKDFKDIQNLLLGENFPWYFSDRISDRRFDDGESYYAHKFFEHYEPRSSYFKMMYPLLDKIEPTALIRIKGNMYNRTDKLREHGQHVDYTFGHYGAIYSINTNDGYTRLHDGTKIESVENRILFFDSSKPHNSTSCTDKKVRVNINFNYVRY
tara:strand:- start:256 stop:747 length:492 start_codon:yes stop_codon:yes gene_type:complete